MDPLSVTLAVVTLATAVKDMVELGQKFHESFAKVSNNLRKAQRAAEEIKEMVEEINVFCQDHKDALDDMKDFCLALQGLLHKFRNFETTIVSLLPQTGGRRRDRLIRGWDSWRNNNKIEESILDLQSDIMKVIRRHMMKSTMRTELKLETIHQETSSGLTGITHNLEIVQRGVFALCSTAEATTVAHCSYESSQTTNEFNRNIIMFAKSTPSISTPMLRTPDVITEELMTAAYIKLQINTIVMALEKMSTLPVSAPISFENFQFYMQIEPALMSIVHLRHHVVRQVIGMRELLDTTNSERIVFTSLYTGGVALNNLSIGLQRLGMDHESILVGKWAITLARTLVHASGGGQPDLRAQLALHLYNQSDHYKRNGDMIHSSQATEEAYTITQNWRDQHSKDVHFQILYSVILLQYARSVDDKMSSKISMAIKAAQVLEDILNVQAFTWSESLKKIENVVQPSSSFLDTLFSSALPITAMQNYASALQQLGIYLFMDDHPEIGLDLQLLAIAVCRNMVSIYGHEHQSDLADALSVLVQNGAANRMPRKELVNMADECIQLLRDLAEKNPLAYARELVSVLWADARALDSLNRDTEAITALEEAASLAENIIQDSAMCATALGHLSDQFRRLARHEDAARTGTLAITTYQEEVDTQALRYFYLAKDLQQLRRHVESVEAARTSAALYRRLAMRDPGTWMCYLTVGLSNLACCLAVSGDYSEALMAWKESVGMLDGIVHTNKDASSSYDSLIYLSILDDHLFIGYDLLRGKKSSLGSTECHQKCPPISCPVGTIVDGIIYVLYTFAHVVLHSFM